MATLVLGTVGRALGGPIGGIIGTVVGGAVDGAILGGGGRSAGRISNLAVQSAAYGEPIPVIVGHMRAAGNLLWTTGISEASSPAGYSYSASFAVGLAARRIAGIGRIWADGRLIRDAAGMFLSAVTMRLHDGNEDQAADPLITAAEGAALAPAYRGIAYAVFENLPLADYGNRIPNLSFEILADAAPVDAGSAISALGTIDGEQLLRTEGEFPAISGYFAGQAGSLAGAIAPLLALAGAAVGGGGGLVVRGTGGEPVLLVEGDTQAQAAGAPQPRDRHQLLGGETRTGAIEISFYDTSRDYQPGLQRARRDCSGTVEQQAFACAMAPAAAKTLAATMLGRSNAGRLRTVVRLPWRYLGWRAGGATLIDDSSGIRWRVRESRFENFVVSLDLERIDALPTATMGADGGRVQAFDDRAAGPTLLRVLDLPPLPGDLQVSPRLWVAASGGPGWRRAAIEVSGDGGASYAPIGVVEAGVVQGTALTALPPARVEGWDRFGTVDVALSSDTMWLQGLPEDAILAGGNLALLGDELIQFAAAEALGPCRFRLHGLLRGRRGSEAAIGTHVAGERFILLDPKRLLAFDPPMEALGRTFRFRAVGAGDLSGDHVEAPARGAALRPLSPARLMMRWVDDDLVVEWVRRSRAGFGWADFVDAPIGEAVEAYHVDILRDGVWVRGATVNEPRFVYAGADVLADGHGPSISVSVAQLSADVGPGAATVATIILDEGA